MATDSVSSVSFSAAENTLLDDITEADEAATLVKPYLLPEPEPEKARHLFDGIVEKGKLPEVVDHLHGLQATHQDHALDSLTTTLRSDQLRVLLDTAHEMGKPDLAKSIEDRIKERATPQTQQQVRGLEVMNIFKVRDPKQVQGIYGGMNRNNQVEVAQSLVTLGPNRLDAALKFAEVALTPNQLKTLKADIEDYKPLGPKSPWQQQLMLTTPKMLTDAPPAAAAAAATGPVLDLQLMPRVWIGAGGNMMEFNAQATAQFGNTKVGVVGTYQLRAGTSETVMTKWANAGTPGGVEVANTGQWQAGIMGEQKVKLGPVTTTLDVQLRSTANVGNPVTANYGQMDARAGIKASYELLGEANKPGNLGFQAWARMQDLYAHARPLATKDTMDAPDAVDKVRDNIFYVWGGAGVHGTFDLFGLKTTVTADYNLLRRAGHDSRDGGNDLNKDGVRGDVNVVQYFSSQVEAELTPQIAAGFNLNYTLSHTFDPGPAVNLTMFEQNGPVDPSLGTFDGNGFKALAYLKLRPFAPNPEPKPAEKPAEKPVEAGPTELKKPNALAEGRLLF